MHTTKSSRAIIIVPLDDIYRQVKTLFKSELPQSWFDNNEIDEIITRIFDITIKNILNDIEIKHLDMYKQCYQGNIDYLEYCGISQTTAFKITHLSEMGILRAIFDTCPVLDDKRVFSIYEHKFVNMSDLHIIVQFNSNQTYEQNFNYSNGSYSKIV